MGAFDEQNPISGTPMDPARRMAVRLGGMGGWPGSVGSGGIGGIGGFNESFIPSDSPETQSARPGGGGGAQVAVQGGQPQPQGGQPSQQQTQPAPIQSALDNAYKADDMEDQVMRRLLAQNSDPGSGARIQALQDKYNELDQPRTLKSRILRTAIPLMLGGAISGGGPAGFAGAARGAQEGQQALYDRRMKQKEIVLQQMEQERQRQERQYERQLQIPVTMASLAERRLYHGIMGQASMDRAKASGVSADARMNNSTNQAVEHGVDPTTHIAVTDPGQLTLPARAGMEKTQAQTGLIDAQTDNTRTLQTAHQQLLEAQAGLARARAAGIPAQVAVAQQRVAQAKQNGQVAMRAYYRDTYGTELDGTPIEGGYADEGGQPIGWKSATAKNETPSGQTKSRADQGRAMDTAGKELVDYINTHRDRFGNPEALMRAWVNNTPISDPETSEAMSKLGSYYALNPALHGFRSAEALGEFQKIYGGIPKNPDALIASIGAGNRTAQIVQQTGKIPTVARGAGRLQRPQGQAAQGQAAQGQGQHAVGEIKRFPNGKMGKWDGKGWVAQ